MTASLEDAIGAAGHLTKSESAIIAAAVREWLLTPPTDDELKSAFLAWDRGPDDDWTASFHAALVAFLSVRAEK